MGNNKKETLEEAMVDYSNDATQQLAFLNGVKWQAERMYSEEDMIAFGECIFKHSLLTRMIGVKNVFEQFKNK